MNRWIEFDSYWDFDIHAIPNHEQIEINILKLFKLILKWIPSSFTPCWDLPGQEVDHLPIVESKCRENRNENNSICKNNAA